MKNNKLVLECECGTEVMTIHKDIEDDHYYFAVYRYKYEKPNFFQRLKYALYHLKTGEYYSDELVLNKDEIKKLKNYIDE